MTLQHEGVALGHRMAELAADHAGEQWRQQALDAFLRVAKQRPTFTTEVVRAANPDLASPADERAWGAVALKAKMLGAVKGDGWVRAESRNVHGRPVTLWQSQICAGQ